MTPTGWLSTPVTCLYSNCHDLTYIGLVNYPTHVLFTSITHRSSMGRYTSVLAKCSESLYAPQEVSPFPVSFDLGISRLLDDSAPGVDSSCRHQSASPANKKNRLNLLWSIILTTILYYYYIVVSIIMTSPYSSQIHNFSMPGITSMENHWCQICSTWRHTQNQGCQVANVPFLLKWIYLAMDARMSKMLVRQAHEGMND